MRQSTRKPAEFFNKVMMKLLSTHVSPAFAPTDYVLGALLLAYPSLLFIVPGGMNGSLFAIAAISLLLLITRHNDRGYRFDHQAMLFGVAMSSGMVVVLLSQLYHHDLSARYFDSDARFLLAVPVLLALRQLNMRTLSLIQYAFPLGAFAALAMVMVNDPTVRYFASTSFLNHIHLGDMALLLAIFSFLSIDWFGKDRDMVKALKITGIFAGLAVSVLSSARGGWAAIPVIVAASIYARDKNKFFSRMALALLAICTVSLLGYFLVDSIHQRIWTIYSDLTAYSTGQVDTSLGIRFQLWKAAAHMIADNPLLGVGADGFGRAMDGLSASGVITQEAASYGKGEVHSEILAQTVRFGIFGLGFILAIYFVPFYLFFRAMKSTEHTEKVAAVMGMSVTLGFFVFGLTVETFDLKMTAAFYSLTVAVLLAMATNKHNGIETKYV